LGRVFCGNSALEGEATGRDVILSQAELLKRCACSNLDLCRDNIDSSNFLGDGVLDLNTGVDLDEVVSVPWKESVHTYAVWLMATYC